MLLFGAGSGSVCKYREMPQSTSIELKMSPAPGR